MRWYESKIDVTGYITLNNQRYPVCDIRNPLQQNEHCPVCDEHIPDVRYEGSVLELEQIDEDTWILADGSVAVEDGHGGLMVSLCIDCVTQHNAIEKRNKGLPQDDDGPYDWCTKTRVEV
jgi:hypothetical protein